jgi:hypothetical protein
MNSIIKAVCPHTGTEETFQVVRHHEGPMAWCQECRRVWLAEEISEVAQEPNRNQSTGNQGF